MSRRATQPPVTQGGTQAAALQGARAAARERAERDRQLRHSIRNLAKQAEDERDEVVDLTTDKLQQMLTRLDGLQAQAVRPREHAEDASAFGVLAARGLESSRMLAAGGEGRTPRALLARVAAALGPATTPHRAAGPPPLPTLRPGDLDWGPLATAAASAFRVAVGASCGLGPIDVPRRARAAPARRAPRDTPPPLAAPAVREVGAGAPSPPPGADGPAQETDARMVALYRELLAAGDAGARVITAILDHSSFATTVENLFALSFLIRDGRVALGDSAGGFTAHAVGGGVAAADAAARLAAARVDGSGATRQLVLAYNQDDWEDWCAAVDEADCIMPRHTAELAQGGGGGGGGHRRARDDDDDDDDEDQPAASKRRRRR